MNDLLEDMICNVQPEYFQQTNVCIILWFVEVILIKLYIFHTFILNVKLININAKNDRSIKNFI